MKQTILLTKIEAAAFAGVAGDLARATNAYNIAQASANELVKEVAAAHGTTIPDGVAVTSGMKDGRPCLEWEPVTVPPAANETPRIIRGPGRPKKVPAPSNGDEAPSLKEPEPEPASAVVNQ